MTHRLKDLLKGAFYLLLYALLLPLAKVLFRVRIRGRELLERGHGYIAVARHRSYWDSPLVAVAFGPKHRVHFIARRGLMKNPLFNPLIRLYATPIDRENFTRTDFRSMVESIRREPLVAIFPEGTTRHASDAKAGAIHFAQLTGKELLPVNIVATGPYPPRYPFHYPRLTITIGQPFSVADLEKQTALCGPRAERYRLLSERLMARVDAA